MQRENKSISTRVLSLLLALMMCFSTVQTPSMAWDGAGSIEQQDDAISVVPAADAQAPTTDATPPEDTPSETPITETQPSEAPNEESADTLETSPTLEVIPPEEGYELEWSANVRASFAGGEKARLASSRTRNITGYIDPQPITIPGSGDIRLSNGAFIRSPFTRIGVDAQLISQYEEDAFCGEWNGKDPGGTYSEPREGNSPRIKLILTNYYNSDKSHSAYIAAQTLIWASLMGTTVKSWGDAGLANYAAQMVAPTDASQTRYWLHPNIDILHTQNAITYKSNFVPGKYTIKILKKNEDGSIGLPGATFTVTGPNGYTSTGTTTASGELNIIDIYVPGVYTVTETAPPPGYELANPNSQTVTLDDQNKTAEVTFNNKMSGTPPGGNGGGGGGTFSARKVDAEDGFDVPFWLDGNPPVYALQGDNGFYEEVTLPVYKTLAPGNYEFWEITAPWGYVLDSEVHTFTIPEPAPPSTPPAPPATPTPPVHIDLEVEDTRQKGYITIRKVDADNFEVNHNDIYVPQGDGTFEGAVFNIISDSDIILADGSIAVAAGAIADTITTDRNGYARSKALELGSYTLVEVVRPEGYRYKEYASSGIVVAFENGYTGQDNSSNYFSRAKDGSLDATQNQDSTSVIEYENTISKGTLEIIKHYEGPIDNDFNPDDPHNPNKQPIKGAKFQVFLKSKLGAGWENTDWLHGKPMPNGYTPGTDPVWKNALYLELTTDSQGKAGTMYPSTITYYLRPTTTGAAGHDPLKPVTSPVYLPYGEYIMVEVSAPQGYIPVTAEFKIGENDEPDKEIHYFILEDKVINQRIQLYKIDGDTYNRLDPDNIEYDEDNHVIVPGRWGIPAAGVKFKIWDVAAKKYIVQTVHYPTPHNVEVFETNADGWFEMDRRLVYGDYEIHELSAPWGYYRNPNPIPFKVLDPDKDIVLEVEFPNNPQYGNLKITKTGEALVSAMRFIHRFQPKIDEGYTPVFGDVKLPGAEFEIYAKTDISTPDGTLRFRKDELVQTIVTGADGIAKSKDLYLGDYYYIESGTPLGYVVDKTPRDFSITYQGQEIERYDILTSVFNVRQNVRFEVNKVIETTYVRGVQNVVTEPANGITFGLFAAQDFYDFSTGTAKLIPENALIELIEIKKGVGQSTKEYPLGNYYMQELEVPSGIVLSETKYPITFAYDKDQGTVINIQLADANNPGSSNVINYPVPHVEIEKVDAANTATKLSGARFTVTAVGDIMNPKDGSVAYTDGQTVTTFTTGSGGNGKSGELLPGTYKVTETSPPPGYQLPANPWTATFTLTKNGEVARYTVENGIKPKPPGGGSYEDDGDDARLIVYKEDENGKRLGAGFVFALYKVTERGDIHIQDLTTDSTGTAYSKVLDFGRYYITEIRSQDGYILDSTKKYVDINTNTRFYITVINKAEPPHVPVLAPPPKDPGTESPPKKPEDNPKTGAMA